ncbi:MAG: hypothetical protein R3D02_12680 [Hyphomicrobiales bacterium]
MEDMAATPSRATPETLAALRAAIARLGTGEGGETADMFSFGCAPLDGALGGGLPRAALHEVLCEGAADAAAATGFALAMALRAAAGRPLVWVRQEFLDTETGGLYAPGLVDFGLDPQRLVLVRAADPKAVLRAAGEAARAAVLGAVLFESIGEAKAFDLTASRRLALAAGASGVTLLAVRIAAPPAASAAVSRWRVAGAASAPLEANAPGHPAFSVELLRHRAGLAGRTWVLEWNRERHVFGEPAPLSGGVVSLPVGRPAASAGDGAGRGAERFRRTG